MLVLPMDVLIIVQSFMKPLDIQALQSVRYSEPWSDSPPYSTDHPPHLSQTCRAFRDPTLRRTVWREALRRVVEENDVFAPTFPSLQSMSTSELSYAALRPQVFLRRVRRCASSCPEGTIGYLEPLRRNEIQLYLHERDEENDRLQEYNPSFLIPGGRYLVVTLAYYVYIYDLRRVCPAYDPVFAIPAEAVDTLQGPHHRKWGVCFCMPRGDDLFLFITVNMETETEQTPWVSAVVYKVQGLPGSPRGEVVARFDAQQSWYPCLLSLDSVEGERVSFTVAASFVGVWDFARNELASWTCFGVEKCIIVGHNLVVVTRECGILVYEIPPLEPLTTDRLYDSALAPIYVVLPPENMRLRTIALCHSWENVRLFDLRFGKSGAMADTVVWYRIEPPPQESPNDPVGLVVESIRNLACEGPGRRSAFEHTLCKCDDTIIDTQYKECCEDGASRDSTRVTIRVEPWNGEGEQGTVVVDLMDRSDPLWTRESDCSRVGPEECTFCPISGRLIQMAKDYGVVVIFDYVPSPIKRASYDAYRVRKVPENNTILWPERSPEPSPVSWTVEGGNSLVMALLRLPSELLAHVQSFLTPFNIFCLHLTSNTIRKRASCRAVWREALCRTMVENDIFGPTFDQAHMSIEELRCAALRPQLFLNSIKSDSSDGPDYGWPDSTREIVLETAWNFTQWEDPVKGLHLIQGGRYLLMDTHLSLCIYDMEDPLNDVERLEPIFSLDKHGNRADDDLRPWLPFGSTLGKYACVGDEIILFFSSRPNHMTNSPASLLAYKIRGFPYEVTGEKLAQLSLTGPEELSPRSFCATDRRLAFVGHGSEIIGVWDYEHNQVALMKVSDRYGLDCLNGCVLTHNSIIFKNSRGFYTYAIPPFAPATMPPLPLKHEVMHSIESGWIGSGFLYSTNQAGATFLDLHYLRDDSYLDRYCIESVSPNDFASLLVPAPTSENLNLYPDSGYEMQCCDVGTPRACVGSVFILGHRTGWIDPDIDAQLGRRETYFERLGIPYEEWNEEDYTEEMDEAIGRENDQAGVFIHVEHRNSARDEDGQYDISVVELLDRSNSAWGQRELRFVDFCPASGRLCAIVEEGDEPPRLLVFDYLPASM
ncbi:uncharacterized protein SCHCODRAFT_02682159 [Schizophyllum commune H4-8]|nr:uncharacterized protein SCHCODRAFT_02682159 [Schizophyllum commune H4-8]KAI5899109.1 hypothetical protein SCHCODRAFT_02682159 [Schizophyllum commune H4-8]